MDMALMQDVERMLADSAFTATGAVDAYLESLREQQAQEMTVDPYAGQRAMVNSAIAAGDTRLARSLLAMR